ncbi:hypothetical protein AJ80_02288 [Polytolypa hystricis UAMH7299]|uniref:HAM1-like N-terminal domain-containing protein n=1 Tax=Polytolypa hystricis (strain UAMH7299) TaxID=1447883 RepID=A0A2B7YS39_POLH7|nr:hypothetical protein AJ80_02288 [Polytolypa hystricis UAMH7299]
MWSSCFKSRRAANNPETQPLLPQYQDDTALQRQVHQKLHTYQIVRALSNGYMPSTEQLVANLRALLVSDFLNPDGSSVSNAGRRFARDGRLWIQLFIEFLQGKNKDDQLQDIIWQVSRSKVSVDTGDIASRALQSKAQADTKAAYESIRTVGSLLLTNEEFRLFVDDLATIGRIVFADTASSLSSTSAEAARKVEPSESQKAAVKDADVKEGEEPPSAEALQHEAQDVASTAVEGIVQTGRDTLESTERNISGKQRDTLISRLKSTISSLRNRPDYSSSVATITHLIQRYGKIYSQVIDSTVSAIEEDVEENAELTRAIRNSWDFLGGFGDRNEWQALEQKFHDLLKHSERDPGFEHLINDTGNAVYNLFTDPAFFDSMDKTMDQLKEQSNDIGSDSDLRGDMNAFLEQLKRTIHSVSEDKGLSKLVAGSRKLGNDVLKAYHEKDTSLSADALHVFLPLLIRSIQHIPIPRLEISVPEMDLLLENVVLEPGHTFHASSFLPYRVLLSTRSDMELRKSHSKQATTKMTNIMTVTMNGLNISAHEFGYWIRVHAPPFLPFFGDEGIASFALDQRGIDISFDLEIGRERIEQLVSVQGIRVHIHKLEYNIQKGTWSFLWWIVRPVLKHMVRRVLEKKIAEQIVAVMHVVNRELVFARERLRATRIADPDDLFTFVRAVLARLTPQPDPDVYTRVGVDAQREGVFKDLYTPASVMKLWHAEGERAGEAIEDGDQSGGVGLTWRNDIFNVVNPRPVPLR